MDASTAGDLIGKGVGMGIIHVLSGEYASAARVKIV
jgi:hypothetical protein